MWIEAGWSWSFSRLLGRISTFAAMMLVATVGLVASQATAATLVVDGTGQLLGATSVDVGGLLYDVSFQDGTCIALYSGCDDPSDYVFQTRADAELASQALLDQVFIDQGLGLFDSQPNLTLGCANAFTCRVLTPFLSSFPNRVARVSNFAAGLPPDAIAVTTMPIDLVTTDFADNIVYAVWSPTVIPEPTTGVLLALGLAGLSTRRRARLIG